MSKYGLRTKTTTPTTGETGDTSTSDDHQKPKEQFHVESKVTFKRCQFCKTFSSHICMYTGVLQRTGYTRGVEEFLRKHRCAHIRDRSAGVLARRSCTKVHFLNNAIFYLHNRGIPRLQGFLQMLSSKHQVDKDRVLPPLLVLICSTSTKQADSEEVRLPPPPNHWLCSLSLTHFPSATGGNYPCRTC